jgi:hypothetical protein
MAMTRKTRFALASSSLLLAAAVPVWATSAQVPEPNILALFGIGAAGAILLARHIKRK